MIKRLNMESVFYNLLDYEKDCTSEKEKEIKKNCTSIEDNKEFQQLFFFIDRKNNEYLYESKNELDIIDFLCKYFDADKVNNFPLNDYRSFLEDIGCFENDLTVGDITIESESLNAAMIDEFLTIDEFINRLINAKDFYEEFNKLKKDVVMYVFDMMVEQAREEIENLTFR